jgi:hypothetical protein
VLLSNVAHRLRPRRQTLSAGLRPRRCTTSYWLLDPHRRGCGGCIRGALSVQARSPRGVTASVFRGPQTALSRKLNRPPWFHSSSVSSSGGLDGSGVQSSGCSTAAP